MSDHETVLNVVGMTCGSCVKHVDRALRSVAGVADVEVRLREKEAVVRHPLGSVREADLIEALRTAGYDGAGAAEEG